MTGPRVSRPGELAAAACAVAGLHSALEGAVAVVGGAFWGPQEGVLVLRDGEPVWGLLQLVGGGLLLLSCVGLLLRQDGARRTGLAAASVVTAVNLAFVTATPRWALLVLATDTVALWTLARRPRRPEQW